MTERQTIVMLAVIGILGGVLGSSIGYIGERSISNSSRVREERLNRLKVLGVARVYEEDLSGAANTLKGDEGNGVWPSRDEGASFELPSSEDRSLVVAELSPTAFAQVAEADKIMHYVVSAAYERQGATLSARDREYLAGYIPILRAGAKALSQLAAVSTFESKEGSSTEAESS
jgi:hypothetical protein